LPGDGAARLELIQMRNPYELPLARLELDKMYGAQNERVSPNWPIRGRKSLLITPKFESGWFVSGG
jgi:hypothetical protein